MLTPRDHLTHLITEVLAAAPPSPTIPVETSDFPPWARMVIAFGVVLIGAVFALARVLPQRTANPAPVPAPAASDPAAPTLVERVEHVSSFNERVLARLEKATDEAIAETARLREKVDEIRAERDEAIRAKWEMQSQLSEVTRRLEGARDEVVRLRARLDAQHGGYQGGSWS